MRFLRLLPVILLALAAIVPSEAAKTKSATPDWEKPMIFTQVRAAGNCEPMCPEWIAADGRIAPGTSKRFQAFLKSLGDRKLPLVIQSAGGDVESALAFARILRARGMDVAVGWTRYENCSPRDVKCTPPKDSKGVYRGTIRTAQAYCNSACPLILSGGVNRISSPDASVGVHQVTTTWKSVQVMYRETYQIVNGRKKVISRKEVSRKTLKPKVTTGLYKSLRTKLTAFYDEMGVDRGLIAEAEKTPANKISDLSKEKLLRLKLVTSMKGAAALSDPGICKAAAPAPHCVARNLQN